MRMTFRRAVLALVAAIGMGMLPARGAESPVACRPRIALHMPRDAKISEAELRGLLERTFCGMKREIVARGVGGLGKRKNRILEYLDGRRTIDVVWKEIPFDKNGYAAASGWRFLPFGRKRIYIGSKTIIDRDLVYKTGAKRDGKRLYGRFNPRMNLENTLLHELVHVAGFFLATEREAQNVAERFYPTEVVFFTEP